MHSRPKNKAQSTEELALLHKIMTSIQIHQELHVVLEGLLRTLQELFGIEGASIALHDPEKSELFFIRVAEEELDGIETGKEEMRFPDTQGIAGQVFHYNESLLIKDTSQDLRYMNKFDKPGVFVPRNMICVPLRTRTRVLGVLYAMNKTVGTFHEREVQLLEIIASMVSNIIENTELYGDLRHRNVTLRKENKRLLSTLQGESKLEGFIGQSASTRRLIAMVEKIMESETTVLLRGETGTGKGLLARIIHFNGLRKDAPFITENCGAIAENLLESELFGYAKGAFTGATQDKSGLFQLADGGTLFLDEIGETSMAMQVKLLRAIEEGVVRPVGGRPQKVNVRIIAATHRDLKQMVDKGLFRQDLFYRLNVFPIHIPPLRERREDIPSLVRHLLQRNHKKAISITPKAMTCLQRFDWPGNIRQLENEIERACLLSGPEQCIELDCLSEQLQNIEEVALSAQILEGTLREVVQRIERQMVGNALAQHNGNRSQAARTLGLTRQGLMNKIKRYSLG